MKRKYPALTSTLGPNATQVLGRIKVQLDPQPQLRMKEASNYVSEGWVQWFMRIHNAPRVVAINEGYKLLDYEGDTILPSASFNLKFTMIEQDPFLKMMGVTRIKDYFALGGHLVRQQVGDRFKKI